MIPIAITLACLAAVYYIFRPSGKYEKANRKNNQGRGSNKGPYRAASINAGRCACTEAKSLGDKRFFLAQAPKIPLHQCDAAKCDCRYVRHDDRRVSDDRRAAFCLQTDLYEMAGKAEKRIAGYSRRHSDSCTAAAASDFQYNDIKWVN